MCSRRPDRSSTLNLMVTPDVTLNCVAIFQIYDGMDFLGYLYQNSSATAFSSPSRPISVIFYNEMGNSSMPQLVATYQEREYFLRQTSIHVKS